MALREVFAKFTTRFNGAALKRGDTQVRGLTGRLGGAVDAVKAMGAAFAGLTIVRTIRGWISAVADFVSDIRAIGDELDKTGKVVGMTSATLQEWRHAANLSGVAAESFTQGLVRMQLNMRQAIISPTSSAAKAFQTLGVSITDTNGDLRDVNDILMDMADPLHDLSSASEKVAILSALAGRAGARMGPLFAQGREGVAAARAELEQLGGGMSQVAIQDAADLTDAMARMNLATLSLKSKLAVALLPAIQKTIEAFTKLEAFFARHRATLTLIKVAFIALGVVAAFVAQAMFVAMLPILIPLALIVVAVGAVILVIQDLYTWFQGGDSVLGDFIGSINEVVAAMDEVYNSIARVLGLPEISHDIAAPPPPPPAPPGSRSAAAPLEAPTATPHQGGRGRRAEFLAQLASAGTFAPPAPGAGAAAAGRAAVTNQSVVSQTNTISITGVQDPEAVGRIVRRQLDRANRDAVEALGQ